MEKKHWPLKAFIFSFITGLVVSGISNVIANGANVVVLSIITIVITLIGIMFDMIGTAVLSGDEATFHAKASNKIKGAKDAIYLLKNSSVIASFACDIIGDACCIVSGAMSATIAIYIFTHNPTWSESLISLLLSSIVSSLTVGGKACGKEFAVKKADDIIFVVAKILTLFKKEK